MSSVLDPRIIKNISEKVYRRFPEVAGSKPSVKKQSVGKKNNSNCTNDSTNYLLIFRGNVDIGNGKKMGRWVRVVVDNRGGIVKMTTSR